MKELSFDIPSRKANGNPFKMIEAKRKLSSDLYIKENSVVLSLTFTNEYNLNKTSFDFIDKYLLIINGKTGRVGYKTSNDTKINVKSKSPDIMNHLKIMGFTTGNYKLQKADVIIKDKKKILDIREAWEIIPL